LGEHGKVLQRILSGRSDANIRFAELVQLMLHLGFAIRIRGDHHIFSRDDVAEIVNLQPKGSMAKPYQVRQVRTLITRHRLGLEDDGQV
jgi:hypothetical protein